MERVSTALALPDQRAGTAWSAWILGLADPGGDR
ncbi:TetR family transcriptional regulator [Amycolatopsis vancoresmycina DSM 44592]|uniref:TetR family transcriptional regulator n=1 Tax=Amycolatopsis vancoresmycina DSM 44592 TaxID=1292037 RepID=R1I8U4_9PSEU|nr:TetR family transcriptional regulator [Amycolatopsis vancoresmycina DSM 44592]